MDFSILYVDHETARLRIGNTWFYDLSHEELDNLEEAIEEFNRIR